ncbi:hypothetical protein SAJA_10185 [Salinisphaera japonica YTM-1]|uniref:YhdP central domain-containing protein n=1 Tax=Salinisphaera japonica YTM-1 TaxID=1209778 RepID=A0A423PN68_9GAMM|nr:hypothetical protein SAJA_10185 [Salinisphaera japonica YTM-1]
MIGLAVLLVLLVGAAVVGIPLADRFVPDYQDALIARLEQTLDADIDIDGLSLGISRQGPMVYLDDLAITHHGEQAPAFTAKHVGLAFSLLDLVRGQYIPDGIRLDTPKLTVLTDEGRPRLAHWPARDTGGFDLTRVAELRRRLGELIVADGQLTVVSERLPDGRARWQDIDIDISENAPGQLAASASADGPEWWQDISATGRLTGPVDPAAEAHWHVDIKGLNAPRLLSALADHDTAETRGNTRITFDGRWQDRGLHDTELRITQAPITTPASEPPETLVPGFTRHFVVTGGAGRDVVRIKSRDADAPGAFQARWSRADHTFKATTTDLAATRLARLAGWWQPALAGLTLDGDIRSVSVTKKPGQAVAASGVFDHIVLGNARYRIGPISGRLVHDGNDNTLVFDGADGRIVSERYLAEPLALTGLRGRIGWSATDAATRISLDDLALDSHEATLRAGGTVRLPAHGGAPVLDLALDLAAPDIPRLMDRLPQDPDLPNPKLRDWLDTAITRGTLDAGHIKIKGPADRFPFADPRPGEAFQAKLSGHDLDIGYKPGWPALQQTRGTLTLSGATLDLTIPNARINGVTVDTAHAHVADVREPILAVTGHVNNAPAPQMLSFLANSPLSKKFGPLLDAIDIKGDADLDLDLSLPLKPELGDISVDGKVTARGDRLIQQYLPAPIDDIRGTLAFDETGLVARALAGRVAGVPIDVDILPAPGNRQKIVARATPHLPADSDLLAHYLPPVWLGYVDGALPLRIAFSLGGKGAISPIKITSNLAGTAVELPAPADKDAETRMPVAVTVDTDAQRVIARVDDQRIDLAAQLDQEGVPERVTVRLGDRGQPLTAPPGKGLWIGGHATRIEAKGWFDVVRRVLYDTTGDDNKNTPADAEPDSAGAFSFLGSDITTDRLAIRDRYITDASMRAVPLRAGNGWRVDFDGPDSQGQATYTMGPTRQQRAPVAIDGSFKRVVVHTDTAEQAAAKDAAPANSSSLVWPDLSPTDLPALSLYVADFEVDDTAFGALHTDARVTDNGWSLDRFELAGGALTGRVAADWQLERDITSAGARAKLEGHGLSRLIRIFGFKAPVQAEKTRVDADLSIAPNVAGLDLLHLNGRMDLAMDDGTLLSVEPGPGRLLGLFNLYVLPRRLTLNFRDVVDKGLAFDKARAAFVIRNGQAYSRKAMITTPSSNIEISGRIGLATRDYNERVSIKPKIGSGVAIASAVIGGPAIGAAVFAVQKLLEKPLSEISAVSYRLKGSWDDPQIVEPHAEGQPEGQAQSDADNPADNTAESETQEDKGNAVSEAASSEHSDATAG